MRSGKDQPHDGKVLSLDPRARVSEKMDRIEGYWNKIRGNRLVPSRCEIDPRGLEGVLGHAFILERITGGLARFRIAGSHLNDITGLDLRQMPLSAFFLPGCREHLSDALSAVFDEPSVVRLSVSSPSGFGREPLEGEMILLPLRSDLGDVDRVLGGLIFGGRIGRTPRRIEIEGQTRRSLTGYAGPTKTVPKLDSPAPAQKRSFVPGKDFTRRNKTPMRFNHLRLVVSND